MTTTTRAYAISTFVVPDGATIRAVLNLYPDISHRVDIRIRDVSVPMPSRNDFANRAASRLRDLVAAWLEVRKRFLRLTLFTRDQHKRAIGDIVTLPATGHAGESLRDYLLGEGFAVPYDGKNINFDGIQKAQVAVLKAVDHVTCQTFVGSSFSDVEDAIDDLGDSATSRYLVAAGYIAEATDVEKEPGDDTKWWGLTPKGAQFYTNWCQHLQVTSVDSSSSVA